MSETAIETTPVGGMMDVSESYRVNLEVFEGPLDLLLHLIKKNDLNIYDIPIAHITEEYLSYLDTMKLLDIDLAGEFLLVAAELTHIKSRMLLPSPPALEGEEELDPRADLIRRLLEYQRYKEAAAEIAQRPMLYRETFVPLSPERPPVEKVVQIEGNAFHLIEAFQSLMKRTPKLNVHAVTVDRISVNERIYQVLDLVKYNETTTIDALFTGPITRYDLVITFLALLEMSKLKMIKVYQGGLFQKVYVTGQMKEATRSDAESLIHVTKGEEIEWK